MSMLNSTVITAQQFHDMLLRYESLIRSLPAHLQEGCPSLKHFLSPANYTNWHFFSYYDTEMLSITGSNRWAMLNSPHAQTLLAAYAAQRLAADNDRGK